MNSQRATALQPQFDTYTSEGMGVQVTIGGIDPVKPENALTSVTDNSPLPIDLSFEVSSEIGFGSLDVRPQMDVLPHPPSSDLTFREWQLKSLDAVARSFVTKWQLEIAMAWMFHGTHNMREIGHISLLGEVDWYKDDQLLNIIVHERGVEDEGYLKFAAVGMTIAAHARHYNPERTTVNKVTLEDQSQYDPETRFGESPLVALTDGLNSGPSGEPANPVGLFSTLMAQFDSLKVRALAPLPKQIERKQLYIKQGGEVDDLIQRPRRSKYENETLLLSK